MTSQLLCGGAVVGFFVSLFSPMAFAQVDLADVATSAPSPQSPAGLGADPFLPMTHAVNPFRSDLESRGLFFQIGLTSILQLASDSVHSRNPALWSFSYDLSAQWHVFTDSPLGSGQLGIHLEGGRPIGDRRTSDLSSDIGSIFPINDDLDGEPLALTELSWTHQLLNDRLVITLGKIDPTCFFDANRIANCQVTQFLASPLVNNAAVAFPDNGLGVNISASITDSLYISAGLHDARAVATQSGLNTLDRGEFFWAAELGFTPSFDSAPGNYRCMLWSTEVEDQHARAWRSPWIRNFPTCPASFHSSATATPRARSATSSIS